MIEWEFLHVSQTKNGIQKAVSKERQREDVHWGMQPTSPGKVSGTTNFAE